MHALTCEANVLVFYSLHVEPDGGDSRHHLPELELVQNGGFPGRVQSHLSTRNTSRVLESGIFRNHRYYPLILLIIVGYCCCIECKVDNNRGKQS